MMKEFKSYFKAFLILIPISMLYAFCFNWCFAPNNIAYGGFTGIAQMLHHFIPQLEIGVIVIILNVPIFILGWTKVSRKFAILSFYAMILTSLSIDILAAFHKFSPMDPLLASIYGGVLLGITIGGIALQESSTGGTDLVARLLKIPFPWLPVGRLLLAVDLMVILLVAAVFRDLNSALYGGIALYISSLVMDGVLYGMDRSQIAYIISNEHEKIATAITEELIRGATLLDGRGGYTGESKKVILVAFKQRQIVRVKQLVKDIDPNAFLIVCSAHDVLGAGFGKDDAVGY